MSGRLERLLAAAEARLDARYERLGIRYLHEITAAVLVWALAIYAIAIGGVTLYFDGTADEFVRLLVFSETLAAIALPSLALVWYRLKGGALTAWIRGDRSTASAPMVWSVASDAPVRLVSAVLSMAVPVLIGWGFVAAAILGEGAESAPSLALAAVLLTAASTSAVAIFAGQLGIRPVLRDIARYLPADFEFTPSPVGLAQQLVGRLVIVGLTMTFVGGIVAVITDDQLLRFTLGFTLAPAVLVGLGLVMFPVAALSLVAPVRALIDATRRAQAGDLTARVPVLTSDELGELSHSFNRMIADLGRTTEELRESRARIVATSDAARRRVERDLHDGAQQHLVLLNLQLGQIERTVAGNPAGEAAVAQAKETLASALGELRDLAHGIYPAILESDGLPGALTHAAQRAAIETRVEAAGTGRLPREIEAAVYFCCLEALQNAAKYAGDDARANVRLSRHDGTLDFEVADDGPGFALGEDTPSHGVQNMIDRIGALGGRLVIDSAPGRGTAIRGSVPVS